MPEKTQISLLRLANYI